MFFVDFPPRTQKNGVGLPCALWCHCLCLQSPVHPASLVRQMHDPDALAGAQLRSFQTRRGLQLSNMCSQQHVNWGAGPVQTSDGSRGQIWHPNKGVGATNIWGICQVCWMESQPMG